MRPGLLWVRFLVRCLFRIREFGNFHDLPSQRTLIIANHNSLLDGLFLAVSLPHHPLFVVHKVVVEHPIYRWLLRFVDHEIVESHSPIALRTLIRHLQEGRNVVLFPEGRISVTSGWMKIYQGPAFIAHHAQCRIFPIYIEGSKYTKGSRLFGKLPQYWFPRINVHYGKVTTLPEEVGHCSSMRQKRLRQTEWMRALLLETQLESTPLKDVYGHFLDALGLFGKRHSIAQDIRGKYTYGRLHQMIIGLGHLLSKQPGAHVALLLPNTMTTLSAVIGLIANARVPALLNYTAGIQGIMDAIRLCNASCVVTSRLFVEHAKLESLIEQCSGVVKVVFLEDLRAQVTWVDKLAIALKMRTSFWRREQALDDPAVILFTSGSEGTPKGVVLTTRNLSSQIAQLRACLDVHQQDKVLSCLPLFHGFGLMAGGLLPLFSGVSMFMYVSPLHYRVIPELCYGEDCTLLFGTSTFLGHYAKVAHPQDFHRLRYVVAGAEPLAESVRLLWQEKFGIRIFEGYGTTETSPVIAANLPHAYRQGSVGKLLPGMQAQLVAAEGIEEGGILHVKGPNIMAGYLKTQQSSESDAASETTFHKTFTPTASSLGLGWYETGDIVTIDEDGFLFIIGRLKRFAKIAGEMVLLERTERLAQACSPSYRHACITKPCPMKGEMIILFTEDEKLDRMTLIQGLNQHQGSELILPRQIVWIEKIPILGSGKIDYKALKSYRKDGE